MPELESAANAQRPSSSWPRITSRMSGSSRRDSAVVNCQRKFQLPWSTSACVPSMLLDSSERSTQRSRCDQSVLSLEPS